MERIAIIGSGISGLTAAHLLDAHYDVTLFEADSRLGGHTHTHDIELNGHQYCIDSGFIVFNDRTYPLFNQLLTRIGVQAQKTEMSFSVCGRNDFEYNGHSLNTLFARRRHLLSPTFYRFIVEILRFNRLASVTLRQIDANDTSTLGTFLSRHGFSTVFQQHYILPMGAAIWSASVQQMLAFPFLFFARFFANHGLLNVADRPQWYVIPGGSRQYIEPLIKGLRAKIYLSTPVLRVSRSPDAVQIDAGGETHTFSKVIFACHSDQALALLQAPTPDEQHILGALPYAENEAVLHTDTGVLPARRLAWASWNYRLQPDLQALPQITYNMNILQGIRSKETFCVTLNPRFPIAEERIIKRLRYHPPTFTSEGIWAQQQRERISGVNRTYFCGAYWYNGFHEDGVRSAVDVARRLGVVFP
ncbi:FAD-dependent oxidoreductase [Plesiomonas shigelloides]|uniref:NAD(P)/FAD-dependent oxidoreductase n=1 Tax=Plesiomonas shigelloides TaxID=703 RepID=UPI001262A65A|nr:FAD-dependent oxidoreductase [Plesiomonas shigelloides]KAB7685263.1 FAD-dependent oxidoreductase [Plesiomonas shigelloides]